MSNFSISPDTPILFILLAVLIFLALMAALGSWFRGRGLTRQEAEDLFSNAREQNREELQKFETRLDETRQALDKTSTELTSRLERTEASLAERLDRSDTGLRTIVEQAGRSQQECLTRDLGGMRTDVSSALADARRNSDDGMRKMQDMLGDMKSEIHEAGSTVRESLLELARQQQEAKAHSAIQLCEALISSLGTLRNTIAVQLANEVPTQISTETPANALAEFPSTPESGTTEVPEKHHETPEDHFPDHHSTSAADADISLHEHEGNRPADWADMGVAADAATHHTADAAPDSDDIDTQNESDQQPENNENNNERDNPYSTS